jgi:hypothetical protein
MSDPAGRLGRKWARWRRSCGHEDAAVKVFLEETNPADKAALLRHIHSCPECGRAFEAVRTVWTRSAHILKPIEHDGLLPADASERLKCLARDEIKKLRAMRRGGRRSAFNPKYVFGGAAAVLLILLTAFFVRSRFPRDVFQERTSGDRGFVVYQPWNLTGQRPVVFRWKSLAQADHYELEILDLGLERIFGQEGITTSTYSLPEEVYLRLQKGQTYIWKVTAHLRGGQFRESEFGKFVLPEL